LTKRIEHKSLPALKIGRLCVDKIAEKRKIGTCILAWCVRRIIFMNNLAACRFITLDAKRHQDKNKDSYHFYRKFQFEILKTRKKQTEDEIIKQKSGTTPMYLDLYQVIKHSENKIPNLMYKLKL